MNYTIFFLTGERVVKSTSWDNGLDAAKRYARNQLGIETVHRAEIWDDADRVVFRWSTSDPPAKPVQTMPIH